MHLPLKVPKNRIFVRDLNASSYARWIDTFGLHKYSPIKPNSMQRQLAIVPLDGWTMLADDWYYTLWHMPSTMQIIADAAKKNDIYYDVVGECDESYEFGYFRSGSLVRKVAVASPHFSDQILEIDVGTPFPIESEDRMTENIEKHVDTIANCIGIRLPNLSDAVLAYGPSQKTG